MPSSSFSTAHERLRNPRLERFVDRDDERAAAARLIRSLRGGLSGPERPVLVVHGIGGAGKTALLEKLLEEHKSTEGLRFAILDIDSDTVTPEWPIPELFWRLAQRLTRVGVPTPRAFALCCAWRKLENPGLELRLQSDLFREFFDAGGKGADVSGKFFGTFKDYLPADWLPEDSIELIRESAASAASTAATAATSFKAVQLLDAVARQVQSRVRDRAVKETLGVSALVMKPDQIARELPLALAADVAFFLQDSTPASLAVAVDGFERLQSPEKRRDVQHAFASFCGELLLWPDPVVRGRAAFLVVGRKNLRWGELYDTTNPQTSWDTLIERRLLGGLAEEDARRYVATVLPEAHEREGHGSLATRIRQHVETILNAACENAASATEDRAYLPYFVDMAVDVVRLRGDAFDPKVDLGVGRLDLEERYLRAMPGSLVRTLRRMAVALAFDRSLYEWFVDEGIITDYGKGDFARLVGPDHFYIQRDQTAGPGMFRFHRHMQERLLEVTLPEDVADVVRSGECALTYYAVQAHFGRPAEYRPEHMVAWRRGAAVLLGLCTRDQLLNFA